MALNDKKISVSIVSHGQIEMIVPLLADFATYCADQVLECLLTLNLPEDLPFDPGSFPFLVKVIRNKEPFGFGANHNQAFRHAAGQYFCVVNPDIRLNDNPFQSLFSCLSEFSAGVVAPLVCNENGKIEDSARRFPTIFTIICKAFGGCKGCDYAVHDKPFFPDWVGGMFMLFPSEIFDKFGGFDQKFFLYYEDVDLCARLRLQGHEVIVCPDARVIHRARRSSHRNPKYMLWHVTSMARFFFSLVFLKIYWMKWTKGHACSTRSSK